MNSTHSWKPVARAPRMLLLAFLPLLCLAQDSAGLLTVGNVAAVTARRQQAVAIDVPVQVKPGFHINSDKPADEYLIPLKLTWDAKYVDGAEIAYPSPKMEKYEFSEKPLSVLTGSFTLHTKARIAPSATPGMAMLTGKLRYQGCSDRACYPPKTVSITVPLDIK